MSSSDYSYPMYARILHLGLAVFGIAAYLTGEDAGGKAASTGYLLHAYLGLTLAAFALGRLVRGFAGTGPLRFSGWSPFSKRQWTLAFEDVAALVRLKVPERGMHEGLSGLTQMFGLALFVWMGATGTAMFFLRGSAHDLFEALEEVHEVGETLIPLYLILHVGSVVVHAFAGHPIWRRMWTFKSGSTGGPG
ncbi:MAG: cytochrome b/b6 domain-containing protein [Pseudomonadales bacterium]